MRNTITRTITTSEIRVAHITFDNGEIKATEFEPLTIYGTITEKEAHKLIKKHFAGLNAVLIEIVETDKLYEISIDDFIKHAHVIEKPETEENEIEVYDDNN